MKPYILFLALIKICKVLKKFGNLKKLGSRN